MQQLETRLATLQSYDEAISLGIDILAQVCKGEESEQLYDVYFIRKKRHQNEFEKLTTICMKGDDYKSLKWH